MHTQRWVKTYKKILPLIETILQVQVQNYSTVRDFQLGPRRLSGTVPMTLCLKVSPENSDFEYDMNCIKVEELYTESGVWRQHDDKLIDWSPWWRSRSPSGYPKTNNTNSNARTNDETGLEKCCRWSWRGRTAKLCRVSFDQRQRCGEMVWWAMYFQISLCLWKRFLNRFSSTTLSWLSLLSGPCLYRFCNSERQSKSASEKQKRQKLCREYTSIFLFAFIFVFNPKAGRVGEEAWGAWKCRSWLPIVTQTPNAMLYCHTNVSTILHCICIQYYTSLR